MLEQYKDNEDATRSLSQHRTLLARCRHEGIDAAFADLMAPADQSDAGTRSLGEAVLAFVNAQSWAESKQIVEADSELLLSDPADEIFGSLLEQYADDEHSTHRLQEHRALLARCRRDGIEAAFADRLRPSMEAQGSELGSLLEELRSLTQPGEMSRAITVCQEALALIDREDQAVQWAALQGQLGNRLCQNPQGDRAENIEEAIRRFKLALEVYTRQDFRVNWAATQNNLANAYSDRIEGDRAGNIEEAIRRFNLALEVYTRQDFRVDWAMTQNNLANAYSDRIEGDRAENIEEAIRRFNLALEVYTRQDFRVDWATTQNNLANAYSDRIEGDRAENIEEAIRRYKLALEVRTPGALPLDCRNTAYALGILLYDEPRFPEARNAFEIAHRAVETLRGGLQREGARADLAEENALLYARLVHCCLIGDDERRAFEYAVAGKGRTFVDLLATARFDPRKAGEKDLGLVEDLDKDRKLRQQINELLVRLRGGGPSRSNGDERHSREEIDASLRVLEDQQSRHWKDMAFRHPALTATQTAPEFSAPEACKLAEDLGATLVEYYQHAGPEGGWCAFVVTPRDIRYVPLPDVDNDLLRDTLEWLEWIESPKGRGKVSYKQPRLLHQALVKPLRPHLPVGKAIFLAPFGALHLLPLGAALDPDTGCYTAQDYKLAFAPSLAALRVALDQVRREGVPTERLASRRLLSVAYPGDDPESEGYLHNVLPEAAAVAGYFTQVTPLHSETARIEPVLDSARGQDAIHLGCHGRFDPNDPARSGLLLADGWLTVQHIIAELRMEQMLLATLGACQSGQMKVRRGEEHVGLLQAVMTAGARAVVASLWSVNDTSTSALFEVFYKRVAAGDSLADALAQAAESVRDRWKHPYYWAAFQVSGLAHAAHRPATIKHAADAGERVEETYRQSPASRGDRTVNAKEMVKGSLILLKQMNKHRAEVLAELDPEDRKRVAEKLRDLGKQASEVDTQEHLLALADEVHRLVETTPALVALFLEETDIKADQAQRTVLMEHSESSAEALHVKDHKALLDNEIIKLSWFEETPQDEENQESE